MWLSPALFRFLNALIALNSVHPIFILFRQKEKCWKWQYQPRNVHFPFELQVTTSICACINNENKWRKKTHRKEINLLLIFVHTKTCLLDSQIICFCLLHFTFDFFFFIFGCCCCFRCFVVSVHISSSFFLLKKQKKHSVLCDQRCASDVTVFFCFRCVCADTVSVSVYMCRLKMSI